MSSTVRREHRPSSSTRRRRRLIAVVVTAVTALAGAVGVLVGEAGTSAAARTWYVAVGGDDRATGSVDAPLATVSQAVRLAGNGDTIRIGPGTYRESVQVYRKSLALIGAGEGRTILDGARPVGGFVREFDGRWGADWSTSFHRAKAPHTTAERPEAGWPEQFFLDGAQLREAPSRADVGPGTFFHDVSGGRVILGDDPRGHLVEGSDLGWGVYLNQADGSSLSDLTVRRYATEEPHMAAIRAYSNDLEVRRVTVADNARIGLSVMGDRVVVDDVVAIDNGYLGMHAHRFDDLSVTNSLIHRNNRERFDAWHASGGFKATEGVGLILRGNDVGGNLGPGLWTDRGVRNVVIAGNVVVDNLRSGIEIELSSDVIVVDNVVDGNGEQGVWVLESSRVDVWHNRLSDNERAVWVLDGPRVDLVDVRIGNNVFVGPGRAGVLVGVDDWTEQRNASMMRVVLDGNRYWTPRGAQGLVRWSNWPASLTVVGDLAELRRATGQERRGAHSTAASDPYGVSPTPLVATPSHVSAVRSVPTPAPAPLVVSPTGTTGATPPSTGSPDGAGSSTGSGAWLRPATVEGDPIASRRPGNVVVAPEATAPVADFRSTGDPTTTDGSAATAVDADADAEPVAEAGGVALEESPEMHVDGWRAFGDELRSLVATGS